MTDEWDDGDRALSLRRALEGAYLLMVVHHKRVTDATTALDDAEAHLIEAAHTCEAARETLDHALDDLEEAHLLYARARDLTP
jgi:hypothetical protein